MWEDTVKKLAGRIVFASALLFAAVTFSNSAFAQYGYDYDEYGYGGGQQAHQYGYQSGYRDGYHKGQHEGRENDPGDINIRAFEEATHGYRRWMGPLDYFQDGYRDGYRRGFRMGYESTNRRWRDRDYDDRYRY
jgi:flagellar biosynthesis/type III secretory pathway protein FliH